MKKILLRTVPYLAAIISPFALADVTGGQTIFENQQCGGECHYTQGPAQEKTIQDQLARKGPELWYAGSKFNRPWLETWLSKPDPIRQMKYNSLIDRNPGDHVALSAADATQVADFLMSLTSDVVIAGAIEPKANPKGRQIFRTQMPCGGCHQYEDRRTVFGGVSGPTLVGAGERLNPDWILAYLKDPTVFKPVRMMPDFAGLMDPKDIELVSSYVSSF